MKGKRTYHVHPSPRRTRPINIEPLEIALSAAMSFAAGSSSPCTVGVEGVGAARACQQERNSSHRSKITPFTSAWKGRFSRALLRSPVDGPACHSAYRRLRTGPLAGDLRGISKVQRCLKAWINQVLGACGGHVDSGTIASRSSGWCSRFDLRGRVPAREYKPRCDHTIQQPGGGRHSPRSPNPRPRRPPGRSRAWTLAWGPCRARSSGASSQNGGQAPPPLLTLAWRQGSLLLLRLVREEGEDGGSEKGPRGGACERKGAR